MYATVAEAVEVALSTASHLQLRLVRTTADEAVPRTRTARGPTARLQLSGTPFPLL